MFSKILAVALAATAVTAQTFTTCDPTKKDCPADPALGKSVSIDFTKGNNDDVFRKLDGTSVKFEDGGALFAINKETDAPTMASKKYMFFGKLEVVLKAAPGKGVVTSVVLQSDDLDEIDWEWIGSDTAQVQTNYFGKGDTTTYDRGAYHPVSDPINAYHTYTIDWTSDYVRWSIDGTQVRELKYADAKGGSRFPQTPMEVKIGTWVAGRKDAPKGTVEWAGGYTDFNEAPFNAYYKSITITDNMGGKKGAKEYVYGDKSGSWESIIQPPLTTAAPATVTGAGYMNKANLALGAAGLFFTFLL
ncbi:glycoside hydrolase family 16 protein [Colletotrichum gloeosporioides 23]|nr:glycoside hydrolase family 16 protein [Colletotrichum gloeosporioides 23]